MSTEIIPIRLGVANAYLVRGEGGYILVDTGTPGAAGRILETMTVHGMAPAGLRLILITHGHVDHFGSAAEMREKTGAPVAVHQDDAVALRRGISPREWLRPTSWWAALFTPLLGRVGPVQAHSLEPDITFAGEWRLDEYGVAGRVLPTPGHTPGAVALLLDSGEALVGDLAMDFSRLRRRPGRPFIAWDLAKNEESLRSVAALRPRLVYAGHGGPFTQL
jgi:glyoxylase-like metal-dependent hydrolase (beta-lactamase superfamily II)